MVDNKLKLNDDKTYQLVMSPNHNTGQVRITTPTEVIGPVSCEKVVASVRT